MTIKKILKKKIEKLDQKIRKIIRKEKKIYNCIKIETF